MSVAHHEPGTDAARLRQRGLRVTGPRLAILAMLEQVGGHRSADELVLALRRAGYHHARTTVYNALDDLAQAKLVRAAPVDAGALRYESANEDHHHFVCRTCGLIRNVPVPDDQAARPVPHLNGDQADEVDIVYRGLCVRCAAADSSRSGRSDLVGANGSDPNGATHAGADHGAGHGGGSGDRPAAGRSIEAPAMASGASRGAPSSISGPSTTTGLGLPMVDIRTH